MSIEQLDDNKKLVLNFIRKTNMNSCPAKWKDGYKLFKKEIKSDLTFSQFENILDALLQYHFEISLAFDYESNEYKNFNITNKNWKNE